VGLSNFFRDCAWGLLLLLFLAISRYDIVAALRRIWRSFIASVQPPPAPKSPS
jgi:simple sugar transport system permease protein